MAGTTFKPKLDSKAVKEPDPPLSQEERAALKAKEEQDRLEAEAHFLAEQKSKTKMKRDDWQDRADQRRAEAEARKKREQEEQLAKEAEAARVQAEKEASDQALFDRLGKAMQKNADAKAQKVEDDKKFVEDQVAKAQAEVEKFQAEAKKKAEAIQSQESQAENPSDPSDGAQIPREFIFTTSTGPLNLAKVSPDKIRHLIISLKSSFTKLMNHFGSKMEYRRATPESSYKFMRRCELLIQKNQIMQEFLGETKQISPVPYDPEDLVRQIMALKDRLLKIVMDTD